MARGLPLYRVTSELACRVGRMGRISPCRIPIRKSAVRVLCGGEKFGAQMRRCSR